MNKNKALISITTLGVALFFIFLSKTFSGSIILKQSLTLFGITIHYYGLIMAVAILSGLSYARKNVKNYNINVEELESASFFLVIISFLSARLYHVFTDFYLYKENYLQIFQIWKGGLSIYGALLGGFIGLIIIKKFFPSLRQLKLLSLLDFFVPSLLIGQIIGRFGNFVNYEAYGSPTNLPWKMYVPLSHRIENFYEYSFFHPTFLYESLGNLLILTLILFISKKTKTPGILFFLYIFLYNCLRLFTESLRLDSVFIHGYQFNFLVSLFLIILASGGLVILYARTRDKIS